MPKFIADTSALNISYVIVYFPIRDKVFDQGLDWIRSLLLFLQNSQLKFK